MHLYSDLFCAYAKRKLSPADLQNLVQISQVLGIHQATLHNWSKFWSLTRGCCLYPGLGARRLAAVENFVVSLSSQITPKNSLIRLLSGGSETALLHPWDYHDDDTPLDGVQSLDVDTPFYG